MKEHERWHFGEYIWVYISLALFLLLIVPDISVDNDAIYIASEHKDNTHKVWVRYSKPTTLKMHLRSHGFEPKGGVLYMRFQGDYYERMENVLEDAMDISNNVKFINPSEIRHVRYE